jgi:polyphenol oxidase
VAAKTKPAAGKKNPVGEEMRILRAQPFLRIPWILHGFSTRKAGVSNAQGGNSLSLGHTAQDSSEAVDNNRKLFVRALTRDGDHFATATWPLVTLRQIHSDVIHCISQIPSERPVGDGLITRTPGILVAVLAADCLPVIVADSKQRAVGVFHAGWRGTLQRILEKGVGEMRRHFGTRAADLKAAIGPGIGHCCYQVGPEIREQFEGQFPYAAALFRETKESDEVRQKYPLLFLSARPPGHSELPKKIFLNLAEANRRQLRAAGVADKSIFDLGLCTSCHLDLFFSHRAENGVTGRMMAAAGIRHEGNK